MQYSMKSIKTALAMFAVLAFASCKTDEITVAEVSALSVVNANIGSPSLDVRIGQSKVNEEFFTFGKNVNYFNAYAGEREVTFYEGTEKKASGKFKLEDGKFYSLFLGGKWPQSEFVLLEDKLTKPATDKTHIRFVNMAQDAGELDLGVANGASLVTKKAYKESSDFVVVNGNTPYNFVIRNNGTTVDIVTMPAVTLEAGRSYTIWAKGLKAELGTNALSLSVIKNY